MKPRTSPQQFRADLETPGARQRPTLAREQVPCEQERPPGHLIEPAQHGIAFARLAAEAAAFDG
jgi:hypothetical protein